MLLAIHARSRSDTPPWNKGVVVNAADSEDGGDDPEEVLSEVGDRYEGMPRRGSTSTLLAWVFGIGFGSPLVPEEWKT